MEGGQSLGCQRPSEASVSPTCTWRRAVALLPRLGGVGEAVPGPCRALPVLELSLVIRWYISREHPNATLKGCLLKRRVPQEDSQPFGVGRVQRLPERAGWWGRG